MEFNYRYEKQGLKYKDETLLRKFCHVFVWYYLICSTLSFIKFCVLLLIQAYFLSKLIASFTYHGPHFDIWFDRYVPAVIIMLITALSTFFFPHNIFRSEILGAKIRIISSTVVYEKMLRITTSEMKNVNIGHIMNLFVSDVGRFDDVIYTYIITIKLKPVMVKLVCCRLMDPLTVLATLVFLQLTVGLPAIIGFILLLGFAVSTIFLSKVFKHIGRKKVVLVDERLKLTTEMITEARTMKMFCWEDVYCKAINNIRKKELKMNFIIYCCKTVNTILGMISSRVAIYVTIVMMLLMNTQITAGNIYMCFAVFNISQVSLVNLLGKLIENAAYGLVSFERIQKILSIDEMSKKTDDVTCGPPNLDNVTCSWYPRRDTQHKEQFSLTILKLTFENSAITMITGPVGSGKSTLLLAMAKEVYIHSGTVSMGGSITYMPQEPWLFPSTIKQNILFGLPYDEQRYLGVLYASALSQDIAQFPKGDTSNVDDKGLTLSGGQKARIALARAMYRNSDVYLLDDPLSAVDVKVGRHIWRECFEKANKRIILVSHCVHLLDDSNYIVYLERGHPIYGHYGELKDKLNLDKYSNSVDQNMESVTDVHTEEICKNINNMTEDLTNKKTGDALEIVDMKSKVESPLMEWFRMSCGWANGYASVFIIMLIALIAQTFGTSYDILLSQWIYYENHKSLTGESFEIKWKFGLYYLALLILAEILFQVFRIVVFFLLSIRATRRLHEHMLKSVTKAKMSFFDSKNTGQIINRFSKDMEFADDYIPFVMSNVIRLGFFVLGILSNAVYSNVMVCVPMLLLIAVIIFGLHLFMKFIKPLKRLEASARSPIYTYMNCSLNGVAIIRSHENQQIMVNEFNAKQDNYSSLWILLRGMGNWICFLCEVSGCLITISVIVLTMVLPNFTNSTRIGVGISSSIVLGGVLQMFVRELVDVDNLLVSIERIKEYIGLPPEEYCLRGVATPPSSWPSLGHISFKGLSLFYGKNKFKALNDISFQVFPGEKIGIVGRTGAGKSSIIAALFRLAETEGQIEIDGIDINTIQLSEYRSKLSIIPQNPVILSGSIRRNLDPLNEFEDEKLWEVLENVQLKSVVQSMDKGLEGGMQHFSVGHKQLFCLARTLLYNKKIIIFDEATSNVDNNTDVMIQDLIRTKFTSSTLLIIAHRLQTVIDLDRILVVNDGKVVEFDAPAALLRNSDSVFRKMALNAKIDLHKLKNSTFSKI